VAQEAETLKLYLDIERMRFEERLRTEFRIEDEARNALLPSLLLQPLVENAIKYAVSPLEEGAQITIAAQLVGPTLRVTVSDTGPGLQPGTDPTKLFGVTSDSGDTTSVWNGGHVSTGVGLANIRDRLAQAYGENQRFDRQRPRRRPDGGDRAALRGEGNACAAGTPDRRPGTGLAASLAAG
jgi:sensor histidine kinase YesM